MVVPLSPGELTRKIDAIFKHQSQKDRALFPGADSREFWQRAQARNQVCMQFELHLCLSMSDRNVLDVWL